MNLQPRVYALSPLAHAHQAEMSLALPNSHDLRFDAFPVVSYSNVQSPTIVDNGHFNVFGLGVPTHIDQSLRNNRSDFLCHTGIDRRPFAGNTHFDFR